MFIRSNFGDVTQIHDTRLEKINNMVTILFCNIYLSIHTPILFFKGLEEINKIK